MTVMVEVDVCCGVIVEVEGSCVADSTVTVAVGMIWVQPTIPSTMHETSSTVATLFMFHLCD
jgi:hypothetical protein